MLSKKIFKFHKLVRLQRRTENMNRNFSPESMLLKRDRVAMHGNAGFTQWPGFIEQSSICKN